MKRWSEREARGRGQENCGEGREAQINKHKNWCPNAPILWCVGTGRDGSCGGEMAVAVGMVIGILIGHGDDVEGQWGDMAETNCGGATWSGG